MKRFYVSIFLIVGTFLLGYCYPAFAQKRNLGVEKSSDAPSQSLYSSSSYTPPSLWGEQSVSTQQTDKGTLYAPPPGGGNPIGGVTPIGHGFSILVGLNFFYLLSIVFFTLIKKKKMNKTFIAFLILLTTSLSQAYGQGSIPSTARRVFIEDFGGNNTTDPAIATASIAASILPAGTTSANLTFQSSISPANDCYSLVKTTKGASYAAWWGSGSGTTATDGFDDHTYPNDITMGYMMVINANIIPQRFFQYQIDGLCPNTTLYFSAWAGNLVRDTLSFTGTPRTDYSSYADPSLTFILRDPTKVAGSDTLAKYGPITITKTRYATGGPTWQECYFTFPNEDSESIILEIWDNTPASTGNDLVLDDISVWLDIPEFDVSGRTHYCEGEKLDLSASYDFTKISGIFGNNPKTLWLYTPTLDLSKDPSKNDFSVWSHVSTGMTCNEPAQEGYYVALVGSTGSIDNNDYSCCTVSDTIPVFFIPPTDTLYWKKDPVDQNWNNPTNWLSQLNGMTESPYAPSVCTSVHIPGNSSRYPSLDVATSGTYSACHNICFHFGGLIGQPQLLQYDSAYVQYNFGVAGADPYSAPPMNRVTTQQWYALAAPLQKMASGDFGFCGYPSVYQQSFRTSPQSNVGANGFYDADWYAPENTNSWALANQYNAIAIWADNDNPDTSTGLDGLNGILQIPYYNSPDTIFHRGFSQSGTISYFQDYYDDMPGLPLIDRNDPNHPAGYIDRRTREAYQFIFQGEPFMSSSGAYFMSVQSGDEIMIGNPFMSNLDFNAFAADNPGIDKYRLYVDNNFTGYSDEAGAGVDMQYIAPLQAFFITSPSGILKFDPSRIAVAPDPINDNNHLRSSTGDGGKADVLYLKAESKAGVSWLTLSMQDVKADNMILLLPKGYPEIPQIYATDAKGQKNCIQFEGGYVNSVPLGVLSNSSDQVTLTVSNKDKLNVSKLTLYDKSLSESVNLLTTDSYKFQNTPDVPDRFTLTMESKSATGISSEEVEHPVYVSATGKTLFVNAASGIEDVSVITLQGITVSKDSNIGQPSYTKSLQLPSGLYLVYVKLKTGATNVAKVVIK